MARAARFKAWRSLTNRKRFYYRIIGGNSKTVNPSQSYPSESAVLRACQQEWISFAKALGVYGSHTVTTFLATHPVPFTKDSLQPPKKPKPVIARVVKAKKGEDLRSLTPAQLGKRGTPVFGRRTDDKGIQAVSAMR